jgi:hypothetical protein
MFLAHITRFLEVRCSWHSLAWGDTEDKEDAHNAIRTSTPGQVIDLPKPPDHIIVDIKPIKGIK